MGAGERNSGMMEFWNTGRVRDELMLVHGTQASAYLRTDIQLFHHSKIPLLQYSTEVSVGSESFERSLTLARF